MLGDFVANTGLWMLHQNLVEKPHPVKWQSHSATRSNLSRSDLEPLEDVVHLRSSTLPWADHWTMYEVKKRD